MNKFRNYYIFAALLLIVGCDQDPILGLKGIDPFAPPVIPPDETVYVSVSSTDPDTSAVDVCPNAVIAATFLLPTAVGMDPLSINTANFQVTEPSGALLLSTITLNGDVATFDPVADLFEGDVYTVMIIGGATGVRDLSGNDMQSDFLWSFTVGPPTGFCTPPINLGLAATFGIASTAGITNTPTTPITQINGDVILDPDQTCNAVNVDNAGGFGLCAGSPPTINGQVVTNTFPNTTDSTAIKADLNAAYLSITPPAGPPAAGSLGGGTPIAAPTGMGAVAGSALVEGQNLFFPGVHTSITSIMIANDLTLDAQGNPNALFVFQSASTVGTAAGAIPPGPHTRILLINQARASNVWWQAGSSATLGLYTEFQGNILAAFDITMETGTTSCGRLMAGAWVGGAGAFVFDSNVVSVPGNGCPI